MDIPLMRTDAEVSEEDEVATSLEVTVPALETTESSSSTRDIRKKSVSRTCTLVITPSGQCVTRLQAREAEQEESASKNVFFGKLRETFEDLNLRGLLWLNKQGQGKTIEAKPDVLARYHNSYLYGDVSLSIKLRTALRSGPVSHILIWVEFLAAVISVTAYVRQTYTEKALGWSQIFRRIFALYFAADYVMRIYSAPVRLYYVFSTAGIVDLISSVPIFYVWSDTDNYSAVPQMLRVVRARRCKNVTLSTLPGTCWRYNRSTDIFAYHVHIRNSLYCCWYISVG